MTPGEVCAAAAPPSAQSLVRFRTSKANHCLDGCIKPCKNNGMGFQLPTGERRISEPSFFFVNFFCVYCHVFVFEKCFFASQWLIEVSQCSESLLVGVI